MIYSAGPCPVEGEAGDPPERFAPNGIATLEEIERADLADRIVETLDHEDRERLEHWLA